MSFSTSFTAPGANPTGDDKNGIDNGEWLRIVFGGSTAATSAIIAALNVFDLRVGIHVGSIGDNDYSESLVAVPIPTAAVLFGSALLGFAGFATRRRLS